MRNLVLWVIFCLLFACSDSEQSQQESTTSKNQTNEGVTNSADIDASNSLAEINELTQFKVLSVSEGIFENTSALQINFNLPLKQSQDFESLIKVKAGGQDIKTDWLFSSNKMVLYYPFIEAETQYEINISQSLSSVNNKMLSQASKVNLTTQPKQKVARFVSSGNTLLSSDKDLPIEAVNVDAVELKFWKIRDEVLYQFLQQPNKRDIYSLKQLNKVANLVYTSHYELDEVKNKTEQHNLPIGQIKSIKAAGVYFVTMMPDDASYEYEFESTWFIQTDLGLHTRVYKNTVAVFAHQIPAAQSYPEVQVKLINHKGEVVDSGMTDGQGFVSLDFNNTNQLNYVIAQKDDAINLVRLQQPRLDLTEFGLAKRSYRNQELFLYAPRDLYRPGETVHINGLLRDADGQMVTASPIKVEIRRPDNRLFKSISWLGDDLAFYQTSFTIPKDAMTGTWSFNAKLANNETFDYQLYIEDFLPERLKLDLSAGNDSVHVPVEQAPVINIQSDYLYGAPAAGNRYDATVSVSATTALFDAYEEYHFGSNHYNRFDSNFTTDASELDQNGRAVLALPVKWQNTSFPLRVNAHVNVYEAGGRPIARSFQHTVWPQPVAVGIKPMWDGRFASPNRANTVSLLAVDRAGDSVDLERAEVMLVQENRERYWHWGDDGWDYRNNSQELTVYNAVVNIAADGTEVSLPLDYGMYRVEIRNQDQQLISSYRFFSGWRWYDPYAYQGEKPDQVKLAWQADAVTPGQTAGLLVTAPYVGTALVTVESDELLWHQTIELNQAEQLINVPIDSNWRRHDIHASVMVIQAGSGGRDRQHLPKRSLGVIHMPLDREDRQLAVTIQHPEKTSPAEPLKVTVKLNQFDASQKTYVTLAAVDTGVLNVSQFKTPKPFEWFFAKRQYLPALRDVYGSLIAMLEGKAAQQKFGGDADISRGGDEAKADVQIVSLFTDKVAFNQAGEAEVELDLPYFNGELRLMALAFNEHQFAGTDSRIKVAAPIVIETSLPRFLAKGDQSTATIEIHNTESSQTQIELNIQADAALGGANESGQKTLAADEKIILNLPITGEVHQGQGHIQVAATAESGFKLDRTWGLSLRPAMPAVVDQYKALLKPGDAYNTDVAAYSKFDTLNLKSVLKISDTPVLNREDHLQQLLQYPYGCLEQSTSRAWPLLLADSSDFEMYKLSGQNNLYDQRFKVIDEAISRMLGMQLYSGGFGLWSNDSYEEYWLTVYATDFLVQAKKLGHQIPEEALSKAITRLQNYVRNAAQINSDLGQYLSHRNHFEIAYKAYAAYVLSSMNQISLQDVRRLFDQLKDQARSPLPLAHLAMGLELLGDERRATEAWQLTLDFKWNRNRYDYYGDYGSKVRDYAEVIALGTQSQLLKSMPLSTLDLVVPLQDDIANSKWFSTQERSTLFKAAKMLKQSAPAGSEWSVNIEDSTGEQLYQQSQDLLKVWHDQQARSTATMTNQGSKPVYLDLQYQGYLKKHVAENNGIVVRKKYFDLNGNHVDLSDIKSGDFLLVHLEMSLEEEYNYLPDTMVIDLLPAGLELENQNLDHALKLDDIKVDGKYVRDWSDHTYIKHSEYRDDRFVAAMTLSSYQNAHVFYLARAVTPGQYIIPPALVEDMYRPEIRSTSDDLGVIKIK